MQSSLTRKLRVCGVFLCCSSLWVGTSKAQEDISWRLAQLQTDSVFSLLEEDVAVDRSGSDQYYSPFSELANAENAFAIDESPFLQVAFQQNVANGFAQQGAATGAGNAGSTAAELEEEGLVLQTTAKLYGFHRLVAENSCSATQDLSPCAHGTGAGSKLAGWPHDLMERGSGS